MFLFGIATSTVWMFTFIVPYCLGGIAGPALQSVLAGHVSPSEQGELQGALTSLMSLTTVLGPLLMNYLFKYYTTKALVHFPGAPFLLGAIFMIASAFVAWVTLKNEKHAIAT